MASQVSASYLRGLVLMDPRLSFDAIWSAQSTYTQADPVAGIPEAQGATDLVLAATGTQTADTTLKIRTIEPGLAGDGSFGWKLSGSTNYYGWETPITISGWEAVVWVDGSELLGESATYYPHALTLPSGVVLVAAQVTYHTLIPLATTYQVRVYSRSTAGAWTSVMVREKSSAPTDGYYPALLRLPNGRILCASWLERGDTAQLYIHYSDDDGTTWSVATEHALREQIDTTATNDGYYLRRIRWAYGRGKILLLVGLISKNAGLAWEDEVRQYCSVDDGANFDLIDTIDDGDIIGNYFDVVWTGSIFLIASIPATQFPTCYRIPSADTPVSEYEDIEITPTGFGTTLYWNDISSDYSENGECSLVLSDDGTIFLLGRLVGDDSGCVCFMTPDEGRSWTSCGHSDIGVALNEDYGQWWVSGDASTHPRDFAGTWQRGRIVVVHNWDGDPGNEDNSLGAIYLGGYSDQTHQNYQGYNSSFLATDAYYRGYGRWPNQASYGLTWLPFDEPGDCGWTKTSAGGTDTLATGGLDLDSTGGTVWYYQTITTGTLAICAEAYLDVNTGGSTLLDDIILRVRLGDGAAWYQITVRMKTDTIATVDDNIVGPGSILDSDAADLTGGVFVRIHMQSARVSVWYRLPTTPGDDARAWTLLSDAQAVTDGGAGAANSRIEWGHRSGNAATSTWYFVGCVGDTWAATTWSTGQDNPGDIQGRLYSHLSEYVGEGVSIRAESGPTQRGEIQDIATDYRYALKNAFPEIQPSPQVPWRSTGTTQATIALRLDPSFIADSGPFNDIIALHLNEFNFNEVRLQGYTAGAWSTLATYYANQGLSGLRFNRTGNTIQPSGVDGTHTPYCQFDEFAGCYFVFDDGTIKKILHNSEGHFGSGNKRPTLILDDIANTEPTSGTAGEIRPRKATFIYKLDGADYSAYRILIPNQSTFEGYFTIGTLLVGPMVVFGFQYSWGRSVATGTNRDEFESPDWTRVVRSRAPARRTIEFGWLDGVDITYSYSGNPDYLLAKAAGVAVASYRDTPTVVEGLVRDLAGPGKALVYCPAVPYAGTSITLNRRWQHMLGEVISESVSVENVQGDEGVSEVVRVPNLTIREIV